MCHVVRSLAFAVTLSACSRQEPRFEHFPLGIRPAPLIDSSAAAAATSPEFVDFALPKGCGAIYDPNDTCKTLRSLIDAPARLNSRACLSRIMEVLPDYGAFCRWAMFSYKAPSWGAGKDCYAYRYEGEGVVCTIMDDQHPDDASSHYDATAKAVRACLHDWSYEQTEKARVHVDRGFSMSRSVEDADGPLVTHVQACRYTEAPHSIDERSRRYVRLEVFTERQTRKPTSP
jgi:hypothetical protein